MTEQQYQDEAVEAWLEDRDLDAIETAERAQDAPNEPVGGWLDGFEGIDADEWWWLPGRSGWE